MALLRCGRSVAGTACIPGGREAVLGARAAVELPARLVVDLLAACADVALDRVGTVALASATRGHTWVPTAVGAYAAAVHDREHCHGEDDGGDDMIVMVMFWNVLITMVLLVLLFRCRLAW